MSKYLLNIFPLVPNFLDSLLNNSQNIQNTRSCIIWKLPVFKELPFITFKSSKTPRQHETIDLDCNGYWHHTDYAYELDTHTVLKLVVTTSVTFCIIGWTILTCILTTHFWNAIIAFIVRTGMYWTCACKLIYTWKHFLNKPLKKVGVMFQHLDSF